MIRAKRDGFYVVSEKTGKNLGGPYKSREEAFKRLRQIEFFKLSQSKPHKKVFSMTKTFGDINGH